MKKAIIIIARNEGQWVEITAQNFKSQFKDCKIIGVDDGGVNEWPDFVEVYKTAGGIGVGQCRRLGVEKSNCELICVTDAHVLYDKGDKETAWKLASEGNILTFTTKSIKSGRSLGNGWCNYSKQDKIKYVSAKTGTEIGLIGSVYFMKRDIALDIIAPTPAHGYNEQIMTAAAFALGYKIYAYPDMTFQHLYKNKFNYTLSYSEQNRNSELLEWWFYGGTLPKETRKEEIDYYNMIQRNRKLSITQLKEKFENIKRLYDTKKV
jgi:hypothetical protein